MEYQLNNMDLPRNSSELAEQHSRLSQAIVDLSTEASHEGRLLLERVSSTDQGADGVRRTVNLNKAQCLLFFSSVETYLPWLKHTLRNKMHGITKFIAAAYKVTILMGGLQKTRKCWEKKKVKSKFTFSVPLLKEITTIIV